MRNKRGNSSLNKIVPSKNNANSFLHSVAYIKTFPKRKNSNSHQYFDNSNFLPKSKRSQVTIFIIYALIIVVVIAIIFLLRIRSNPIIQVIDENNPQGSIETCTRQAVDEALERITVNGGDITPGYALPYRNDNIVYICYSADFYKPCSYQRPLLVEHIEREITDYITPKIEDCFEKLKFRLQESSTSVDETLGVEVLTNLFPKHIEIKINKHFQIVRGEPTISFENFKIDLVHPIYDFADIAREIGNQQAKYCYFDSLGYMILNPSFDINETINGNYDKVYVLTERATNHKYQFAVRSCPLPAGF